MSLDLHSTLRKLESYIGSPAPILSVYLEIPEDNSEKNLRLTNLFHDLVTLSLNPDEHDIFAKELESIEGYLQQYKQKENEKGLAFFVGGDNLWEVIHTRGVVPTSLVITHSPNLIPLSEEEKNYRRYLLVLADREKAKFILLSGGEIEDESGVHDTIVPQKINTGAAGSRQNKVDRHFQKLVNTHLAFISVKLDEFIKDKPIHGVIIGGHKTTIHNIEKHLPHHLQDKVLGEFVSELNIPTNQILIHGKKILDKLEIKIPENNNTQLMNP